MEMNNKTQIQTHGRKKRFGKITAVFLAMLLLMGGIIGGTLAWLTDETPEITNTFTVGNIEIELTETTDEYKMIPGWTIEKDPVVTVKKDSEDCWVFIEVTESENLDSFIEYEIDPNNWTELQPGVYYAKVTHITNDRQIKVLLNSQVEVKSDVKKEMMDAFDLNKDGELSVEEKKALPTLTFTAYAVQLYKGNGVEFAPEDAWAEIGK